MKSSLLVISFALGFPFSTLAQNLVPNASFEWNTGCPGQIGEVDKADGWVNWGITPDYFHACSNQSNPSYGTPGNVRGFQVPRTGQAYVGLFTFTDNQANFREFIGRELSQPLVPGQVYFVSLWVCNIEQSLATHASDRIGIRFTTTAHSMFNPDTALNNGHVFATSVINDSINWVRVSGFFTADSAYTHMGVGNYFDDASTTVITGGASSVYAYYLIDDICVATDSAFCDVQTNAMDQEPDRHFALYPNPAIDQVVVTGHIPSGSRMEWTDATGRVVFTKVFETGLTGTLPVQVTSLNPGIYFINLLFPDGGGLQEKFVITR